VVARRRNPARDFLVERELAPLSAAAFDAATKVSGWLRKIERREPARDLALIVGAIAHAIDDVVRTYAAVYGKGHESRRASLRYARDAANDLLAAARQLAEPEEITWYLQRTTPRQIAGFGRSFAYARTAIDGARDSAFNGDANAVMQILSTFRDLHYALWAIGLGREARIIDEAKYHLRDALR
jgi:hypothetical protein